VGVGMGVTTSIAYPASRSLMQIRVHEGTRQ